MQGNKDIDPPVEEAAGSKGGNFTEKCYGLMGLGWRVTKKLAVAGAAISSAPMVLPPLFVVSVLSLIFSVPSTAFLAWYAATDKLMRFLLPPPPTPARLLPPPDAAGAVITEVVVEEEEDGGGGGVAAEESEVVVIRSHEPVGPDETGAATCGESDVGYVVPLEGGEEPSYLPSEIKADPAGQLVPEQIEKVEGEDFVIRGAGLVGPDEGATSDEAVRGYDNLPEGVEELGYLSAAVMADAAAPIYTDRLEVPELFEKGVGEEAPVIMTGADGPVEPDEMATMDEAGREYHVLPESGEYLGLLPADTMADSAFPDYTAGLEVPEQVEKGGGEEAPERAGGSYDVPVESGGIERFPMTDARALDYADDLAVPEYMEQEGGKESPEASGRGYGISVEDGKEMIYQPFTDSAALNYVGDRVVPENADMGVGEEVPTEVSGRYGVPIEGSVYVGHLPAEERLDSAVFDYANLAVPEQRETKEDEEAPEEFSGQYLAPVEGDTDVAHLPGEDRLDSAEQISQLQYPYEAKEARTADEGAGLAAIPDIQIRSDEHTQHDQESVPAPASQEASAEKNVNIDTGGETSRVIAADMSGAQEMEPVLAPNKPQEMTQNGGGTREGPAVEEHMVPPIASDSIDADPTIAIPSLSQVQGPLMKVPVTMTSAVDGTNAGLVVQQEDLLIDHTPVTEKSAMRTAIPIPAAGVPSPKEAPFTEETMWEQIEALRMIIGYTVARQASLVEELKALYLFTGVEPPVSYEDPFNLLEVGNQLQFLKSVVGVL